MSKNIWIINQFAGTDKSGWGERHFYFSKLWKEKGYNVTIISGSYNHVFKNLPSAPKSYNFEYIDDIRFCWIKVPKYNPRSLMRFWSFLVFTLKSYFVPYKTAGKPDYIVVSSMPIFPVVTGYLLKKRFKAKKFIFEIRDLWPLTLIYLGGFSKSHPAVKFLGWFEKFGYKHADEIVSLLPNAKEHINSITDAENKFHYIPNGLDNDVLKKEPLDNHIIDNIPANKFVIGYTGTIGLANALEYFVEAANLLKDDERFHFVIIGDGYLKSELKEKSANYGNVTFFDKIEKSKVGSAIEQFDVCFVGRNDSPLFKHGVSANKYFDYMLAGKPILDSNNYIKDPVELSGCGIIVKPDSAHAIKEGIEKMYNMDSEYLKAMGKKGEIYVKQHHNISFLSRKYIKLFEK